MGDILFKYLDLRFIYAKVGTCVFYEFRWAVNKDIFAFWSGVVICAGDLRRQQRWTKAYIRVGIAFAHFDECAYVSASNGKLALHGRRNVFVEVKANVLCVCSNGVSREASDDFPSREEPRNQKTPVIAALHQLKYMILVYLIAFYVLHSKSVLFNELPQTHRIDEVAEIVHIHYVVCLTWHNKCECAALLFEQ